MKSHQYLLPPFGQQGAETQAGNPGTPSYNTTFIKDRTTLPFLSDSIITYQHWLHVRISCELYKSTNWLEMFRNSESLKTELGYICMVLSVGVCVCVCVCCLFFPFFFFPLLSSFALPPLQFLGDSDALKHSKGCRPWAADPHEDPAFCPQNPLQLVDEMST